MWHFFCFIFILPYNKESQYITAYDRAIRMTLNTLFRGRLSVNPPLRSYKIITVHGYKVHGFTGNLNR